LPDRRRFVAVNRLWNHGCTRINTDGAPERPPGQYHAGATPCRPLLSVFIRVHPWFQFLDHASHAHFEHRAATAATRAAKSMCRTAWRKNAEDLWAGCRTARISTSVAMPRAWQGPCRGNRESILTSAGIAPTVRRFDPPFYGRTTHRYAPTQPRSAANSAALRTIQDPER
jgi:hypothetical protein